MPAPGDCLWIDGFNVLLTLEVALGGGVSFICRDGCLRDIASVHGTYRRVEETGTALTLLGEHLVAAKPGAVVVVLDAPVSNSGRLRAMIEEAWAESLPCSVELVPDADRRLIECGELVASADSAVIDRCRRWTNLARDVVQQRVPSAWVVDLSAEAELSTRD